MTAKSGLSLLRVSYLNITILLCSPSYGASIENLENHPVTAYANVVSDMDQLLQANIYDPRVLLGPGYQAIKAKVQHLSTQELSEREFIEGFNQLWQEGPFSHVTLTKSAQTTQQMADYFDQMNVGGKGASLSFQDETAVLTVTTMMGQDTIRQIEQAYLRIAKHQPENLIIDLRNNQGGAFAILPLVGHLLTESLDAGVFLSHDYTLVQNASPSVREISKLTPWRGWSLRSFWHDVEASGITRIQFEPLAPIYTGTVYVLVNNNTASASELAAEAIRAAGRAVLIGEPTSGSMLSQKPYKMTNGWTLFLPFADYVSRHSGRIEGVGLLPDITIKSELALERAFEQIKLNPDLPKN